MNTRLLVPVVLGVSLAAASAVLFYYVLRRDDEEVGGAAGRGDDVKTASANVIEVSVPKSIMPALIGRGGSNIKEIEKKSGANIIFKKFPERDADICLIRGRSSAAQLAETLVHEFIRDQPNLVEDRMAVPAWACGAIIGTGGESIKEISHRSGARVKVESGVGGDSAGQRTVSFRGTEEQIQLARSLLLKIVAQQKCRREIESSKIPRVSTPPASPENSPTLAAGEADASVPGEQSAPKVALRTHAGSVRRPGGATVEVYVSAVSSPSRFWVQFVGAQTAQLDELVDHMTEYYNNKDNREMHRLSQVCVSQVVAAVFRHDGRWYRARVLALKPNEFAPDQQVADVLYLDYGDSEFVATHELCELRADLLRLRFQAMECFLAGVRPAGSEEDVVGVSPDGQRWDKWHPKAIARFEELTKVARWKSLMSMTCTYKRCASAEGERDKEIPGIKLYDVTEEGEIDIGAVLIEEGWAAETEPTLRASPRPPAQPATPFGDLGASRVLGMTESGADVRADSVPRDRVVTSEDRTSPDETPSVPPPRPPPPSPAALSYSPVQLHTHVNGSHLRDLIDNERYGDEVGSTRPHPVETPLHAHDPMEELKANINRMDSHHDLQAVGSGHERK